MSPPVVAIVDSYAPTKALADEFVRAGAALVRVQSTPEVPGAYRGPFDLSGYLDNIVHRGDLTATVDAVAAHRVDAVVPGGEVGVEFTDVLSEKLGLPTNGTMLSSARRDKYVMVEAVRAAGLTVARQCLVHDAQTLLDWHRDVGGRVVVKPLRSAGGDGVHFCDTPEQSAAAFEDIANSDNLFSAANEGAVAQEYLRGTEYMVNTVSRDGRHRVCEVWRTTRIAANGVLDLSDTVYLMSRTGPLQDQLAGYAFQVLDALGVRHGPAHVEVKLVGGQPVLVEVGARICGANLPYYAQRAHGSSQLDWTVEAYLRPQRFHARIDDPDPAGAYCAFVGLVSPVEGVLKGYPHLDAIRAMESFADLRVGVQPGQRLRRTVNDLTYPVFVVLMHESEETVLRDANTLRYLDGPGFYELLPDGDSDGRT